jgi:hypothetical protein
MLMFSPPEDNLIHKTQRLLELQNSNRETGEGQLVAARRRCQILSWNIQLPLDRDFVRRLAFSTFQTLHRSALLVSN